MNANQINDLWSLIDEFDQRLGPLPEATKNARNAKIAELFRLWSTADHPKGAVNELRLLSGRDRPSSRDQVG